MSNIQMLRLLINQRLTAAAEEIFGVLGRTIAEYEEEISRSKLEIERQRRQLELSRRPRVCLQPGPGAEQDWSSSLDLNERETPLIKEEDEDEPWPDQQDDCPQGTEQNHLKFPLFQSGGLRHEGDEHHVTPSLSKSPELVDSELDQGTSVPRSCCVLDEDVPPATDSGQPGCVDPGPGLSEAADAHTCGRGSAQRHHWAKHGTVQRRVDTRVDKSYTCHVCGKRLSRLDGYQKHVRIHTGEKPYCCHQCGRRFSDNSNYKRHTRTHTRHRTHQRTFTAQPGQDRGTRTFTAFTDL